MWKPANESHSVTRWKTCFHQSSQLFSLRLNNLYCLFSTRLEKLEFVNDSFPDSFIYWIIIVSSPHQSFAPCLGQYWTEQNSRELGEESPDEYFLLHLPETFIKFFWYALTPGDILEAKNHPPRFSSMACLCFSRLHEICLLRSGEREDADINFHVF